MIKGFEDEEVDDSICDKSAELWTVAINRRIKENHPVYSKNHPQAELSRSTTINEKHVSQLQDKIKAEVATTKHK